jgi:hypothetical protein
VIPRQVSSRQAPKSSAGSLPVMREE